MKPVFQRAFTLIEVNLAMLVMAGGVLSMVSLYAFGFRESRQSREDVAGAVVAESVLNALATALSDRDLKWSKWKGFGMKPSDKNEPNYVRVVPNKGWKSYLQESSGGKYRVLSDINGVAEGVFDELTSGYQENKKADKRDERGAVKNVSVSLPGISRIVPRDMSFAIVATRETEKSPVMTLAVRAVRKDQERTLFAQPIYFTEVHFQGVIDTN